VAEIRESLSYARGTVSDMSAATAPDPTVRGLDIEACYAAIHSRDRRFDGHFVTAVSTTGIYCRPSCPAQTPRRSSVRFLGSAAAAQAAGFRACKRCLPDAAPGSPRWDVRADVVARAVRLVDDGVVDRAGVEGLALRLGYSPRQLRRHLIDELGAGPLALARARRAQTARTLLETTDLPVVDVAFAAGFGSLRQCNDTVREVYATTPTALRAAAERRCGTPTAGTLSLRLSYREPFDAGAVLAFLGAHAVDGVESWDGETYARSLGLPQGEGVVSVRDGGDAVRVDLRLTDLRDLAAAVARIRRLLDLDADPIAVDEALSCDPALRPLVARFPGGRVVGSVDAAETAMRTLLGQQVSLAAGRRLGRVLVESCGQPLVTTVGDVTHLFPTASAVSSIDPDRLPMPRARGRALAGLVGALDTGLDLGPGADRDVAEASLLALPGIGPWTARLIRMRALGDPDVLLADDLAVRRSAAAVGLPIDPQALHARGAAWRPWRSYASGLLWSHYLAREAT
jgi:AraC family transcriptional regulator of adaptative response / DNA-3-methyladenine glycosylase II